MTGDAVQRDTQMSCSYLWGNVVTSKCRLHVLIQVMLCEIITGTISLITLTLFTYKFIKYLYLQIKCTVIKFSYQLMKSTSNMKSN